MENLKHVPLALLGLTITKLLLTGGTTSEAAAVFALTALIAVNNVTERSKRIQEIEKKCEADMKAMNDIVLKQNEVLVKIAEEVAKSKTSVESMKLASSMMRSVK